MYTVNIFWSGHTAWHNSRRPDSIVFHVVVHHGGLANLAAHGRMSLGEYKELNNTGCLRGGDIGGLEQRLEGHWSKFSLCVFSV